VHVYLPGVDADAHSYSYRDRNSYTGADTYTVTRGLFC
jgi:hypothetical protein